MALGKVGAVIGAFIVGLLLGLAFDYGVDWGYKVHLIVGIAVYVAFSLQVAVLIKWFGVSHYTIPLVVGEAVALGVMYAQ
jgi:hypothetical protein